MPVNDRSVMTMSELSSSIRMQAHRANLERYRKLLVGKLTRVEREYIRRRIAEEQAEMRRLADATESDGQPDASDIIAERERRAAPLRWQQRL